MKNHSFSMASQYRSFSVNNSENRLIFDIITVHTDEWWGEQLATVEAESKDPRIAMLQIVSDCSREECQSLLRRLNAGEVSFADGERTAIATLLRNTLASQGGKQKPEEFDEFTLQIPEHTYGKSNVILKGVDTNGQYLTAITLLNNGHFDAAISLMQGTLRPLQTGNGNRARLHIQ